MSRSKWLIGSVTFVVGAGVFVGVASRASLFAAGTSFTYTGDTGPGHWGSVSPDWAACGNGVRQSPIDISRAAPDPALGPLRLNLRDTPLALVNNGHTIEEEYESGSTLILGSGVFELLQFHFHTFSEHTIGGAHYPMEMHAVFRNEATGKLAVVGVLFEIGHENPFLASLGVLPATSGEHTSASGAMVNVAAGLTSPEGYWTYEGSLTTPPCSEIVTWFVLRRPAQMSSAQYAAFRRVLGNDFRPVQSRPPGFFVSSTP